MTKMSLMSEEEVIASGGVLLAGVVDEKEHGNGNGNENESVETTSVGGVRNVAEENEMASMISEPSEVREGESEIAFDAKRPKMEE